MSQSTDPQPRPNRTRHTFALPATLLSAFLLRIWLLGDQNVWWDEGLAIWAVRQGFVPMTLWTASDVHPPLYFWLLQATVRLGGESEFSARFLSLASGVVTVAALYTLGKALLGRRIALLGAVLLTFARFHIWWSQEMRMYVVATMWGVLSLYTLVRWLQAEGLLSPPPEAKPSSPSRRAWPEALWFVLATTAGLYTLYLFVAVVLIENVFTLALLLGQRPSLRPRFLAKWAACQVAIVGLFVPWLALALPRMHSWSVATPFDFGTFLRLYATLLTLGISTYIQRYTWLVLPFFAVVAAALVWIWRDRTLQRAGGLEAGHSRCIAFLLALFLVIPPILVYASTQPRALFYSPRVEARYLVQYSPPFYLLLAWSLALLWRKARWAGAAAALFVAAAFLWTLPAHYAGRYLRDEHQTMARIIAAYAEPDDAVLLVSGSRYPIFGYYYGRLPAGPVRPLVYDLPQYASEIRPDGVERELAQLAATHPRLWLAQVNGPMQDPEGLVGSWLDERLSKTLSFGFAYNSLTLYAPAGTVARVHPENLQPQHSLDQPLGRGGRLLGFDLPTEQFRPGDSAHLALYYSAAGDTRVQVRMIDPKGRVLEERSITLVAAVPMGRHQLDFLVYPRTPPGIYRFQVQGSDADPGAGASFGRLRIAATRPPEAAGHPAVAVAATLQDGIDFVGFTFLDAAGRPMDVIRAGESLTLDLYWRARFKTERNYTVFTHLVGQAYNPATAGPVWAGHDSEPLSGGYPTCQWLVGETIVDRHTLVVDAQSPAGGYELEVGMYRLDTMKRLPVLDAEGRELDDRIVLGHFRVVRP